ncbi:GNAT family N-acetyltransferase [Maribacter sp. CXY002]|uniref:GNAT family N-acetyltransferase n=1 Tax=Maribacter luteocoastalis TaxID=3407671 RepID=UPI003B681423
MTAAFLFLKERFANNESVVFLSYDNEIATGFVQLYFSFSSVNLKPTLLLNDLYVSENHRNKNIGTQLLKHAQTYCKENGYLGLALETATDNPAQKLYEKLGWQKESHCFHYFWNA